MAGSGVGHGQLLWKELKLIEMSHSSLLKHPLEVASMDINSFIYLFKNFYLLNFYCAGSLLLPTSFL